MENDTRIGRSWNRIAANAVLVNASWHTWVDSMKKDAWAWSKRPRRTHTATSDRSVCLSRMTRYTMILRTQNRDGLRSTHRPGINLHAILDEDDLIPLPWPTPSGWPIFFDATKNGVPGGDHRDGRFGTKLDRFVFPNVPNLNWPHIREARRLTHRYAIFAHSFDGGTSGMTESILANDFFISLGNWPTPGGTPEQRAGTFMHEFGHALNLCHGGADNINFKPNYHSVMNYSWQTPKDWMREDANNDGAIDPRKNDINGNGAMAAETLWTPFFSEQAFADLDENNLDESAGVGGHTAHWIEVGPICQGSPFPVCNLNFAEVVPENGSVDWDGDGAADDVGVVGDLTLLRTNPGVVSPGFDVLRGHDDWSNLAYYFLEAPVFPEGTFGAGELPEELTHDLHLELNSLGPGPGALEFTRETYEALEGVGFVAVDVVRQGGVEGEVAVSFTAVSGNGTPITLGVLTFPQFEFRKTVTIPIVDDDLDDADETLTVALESPQGGARLGDRSAAEVRIIDDDGPGVIEFANLISDANELDGTATITVVRRNGSSGRVTIDYSTDTTSGAAAGDDYIPTSGTLVFEESETEKSFSVSILDDSLQESTEGLRLVLENPTGGATLGSLSESILRILNVAPDRIEFAVDSVEVGEPAVIAVEFTRTGELERTVSVELDFEEITASAGGVESPSDIPFDIFVNLRSVQFLPGETSKRFLTLVTREDGLAEDDETARLFLHNASAGAVVGERSSLLVTITDAESRLPSTETFVVVNANDYRSGNH